ncbi:hypothetical protein [Geminisphaera colitermitum]|uniref:hypothetical protein n=1 Tax=Geminisphaera colitermitum TaxID=1148786 RepID=UPI000158D601|nr:hypothetical protein [Geminisphaera colitermitum]
MKPTALKSTIFLASLFVCTTTAFPLEDTWRPPSDNKQAVSVGEAAPSRVAMTPTSTTPAPTENRNDRIGVATHFVRKRKMLHWDPQKYIPMIADLGVGWIRDELMWNRIEPERGEYRIPDADWEWINLAHQNRLKIIVTLNGSNSLVYGGIDDYEPEAYAKAAAFLARELKGKVQAIEVINEPFNWYARSYFEGTSRGGDLYGLTKNGQPESWLGRYAKLINKTAEAVKAVNPGMKVIGFGGFPAMNMRMIETGISPAVDGVVLHPYSYRITPEIIPYAASDENFKRNGGRQTADAEGTFASLIRYSREFSAMHNGPRETWLTEWGYTTKRDRAGSRSNFAGFTEHAQAVYIQRRFMECLGLGVENSIVYSFIDDKNSPLETSEFNGEDNFGLIKSDGTPKPAYAAVQRLARETAGLVVSNDVKITITTPTSRPDRQTFHARDGTELHAPDRAISYQFKDHAGNTIIALWSMERISDQSARPADIEIKVKPDIVITATDLWTGRVYQPLAGEKNGYLFLKDFALPPHPVLLRLQTK